MPKQKRSHPVRKATRQAAKRSKTAKTPTSSRPEITATQQAASNRFQTLTLPAAILIFVSFLAYANAWPNVLIWDDIVFSLGDRLSGVSWAEVGDFFTQDVWASVGHDTGLYRPLLQLSVSLDIVFFGKWKAGLHLVNILLHALTTIAVFGLIRQVLIKTAVPMAISTQVALLAAMVFAVHPVHTEVVNSVFNRSEILVTLFVAGGLWWFLSVVEQKPWMGWSVLSVIYLLAMLSRETGIVLPGLTVLVLWLTTPGDWRLRLHRCLPVFSLLIPLAIYIGMRAHALDSPMTLDEMEVQMSCAEQQKQSIPVLGMCADFGKILPASAVWFDGLKLMIWPDPLMTFHNKPDINEWFALAVQVALLVIAAVLALRKKSPGLLLGLMFFYLAILPASRIVGEASVDPHLAERYLYMPSVGIAIVLAFGVGWLTQKSSLKQAVISVLTVMIILTPLTLVRNSKWANQELLAKTDINQGSKSRSLVQALVESLLLKGRLAEAAEVCDEYKHELPYRQKLVELCMQSYSRLGNYDQVQKAYALPVAAKEGQLSWHLDLALVFLQVGRREEAIKQFDMAVATEQREYLKQYLEAEALVNLYPSDYDRLLEARAHLEKSIELKPNYDQTRKKLEDLDQVINNLDEPGS